MHRDYMSVFLMNLEEDGAYNLSMRTWRARKQISSLLINFGFET